MGPPRVCGAGPTPSAPALFGRAPITRAAPHRLRGLPIVHVHPRAARRLTN
ncbi:unnamed protein product [Amoebophrya sp. A120]|nr:unnamed protein product [Amoebophrya sp. A120]|eukprot:GSA120T00024424001.1